MLRGAGVVSGWKLVFTKQAQKDAQKIATSGLKHRVESLLSLLADNPRQTPPRFERLAGDLKGLYSRRINIKHRLVYQVHERKRTVKILRMWTHYE
jgi:toxin YoeB